MKALKQIWHKFKGTIAITALTAIVGIGGFIATVGIEVVEGGPEGSICVQAIADTE